MSFKGNSIDRKKPKARKSPILIKNLHKERNLKKRKENYDLYQDDLPLGSESGFILPSVSLLKDITEDIRQHCATGALPLFRPAMHQEW